MQPITYLILALLRLQTPQIDIVAPSDPAIKVLNVGAGSFSPVTLSLLPYTFVLQNNSTRDITGLAVVWEPVGGKPQTLLADSYTTKRPVVLANGGYAYLRPNQ